MVIQAKTCWRLESCSLTFRIYVENLTKRSGVSFQNLSECVGGTSYRYMNLCDVGYDTVLGACKQPTSEEIAASK